MAQFNARAAVHSIATLLEAENRRGEAAGQLSREVRDAFDEVGLIAIKVPDCLGGTEADWSVQIDAFEAVAHHSLSAAWCLMLYADNTGRALAMIPDSGVDRAMAGGKPPVICGGGGLKMGVLTPVPGGYKLTGSWIYGSGLAQSDYVLMTAKVQSDGPDDGDVLSCIVPIGDVLPAGNWHVMGLKGTGSEDFSVTDVFVPADFTWRRGAPPLRGGPMYRLGVFGYAGLCMPAVMIGATRRAIEDLAQIAETKARGYVQRVTLADRGVFRAFLGAADLKLKAARALAVQVGEQLIANADQNGVTSDREEAEVRAVGTYCADVTIAIMDQVIRYAGGEGVRAGHRFEQTLRDLHMAGTHMFVNDIAYENHAAHLMNCPQVAVPA